MGDSPGDEAGSSVILSSHHVALPAKKEFPMIPLLLGDVREVSGLDPKNASFKDTITRPESSLGVLRYGH
jgi:hypothetical protein